MEKSEALKRLREPFEDGEVGKLPKPYKKESPKQNCQVCGGYHGMPAAHLDFVGHAAVTSRLLEVDPEWAWEPFGVDERGMPALDANGGLWIRLTIHGVTRIGYGDADGKRGGNAVKEAIGDAIRNASMRFGVALDLWHKGDLHDAEAAKGSAESAPLPHDQPPAGWREMVANVTTLEELQAMYDDSAHRWFRDEVRAAFTARKGALSG